MDSDGCVMDTMRIKHVHCFGPCLVREWELWRHEEAILSRWNEINLYSPTRGINRFKGLAMALKEINDEYQILFTLPNSDTDGRIIIKKINDFVANDLKNSKI